MGGWVWPGTESSSTLCLHLLLQPITTIATNTYHCQPTPPTNHLCYCYHPPLMPPTTSICHCTTHYGRWQQWVVSVVGGGDGWWRIMSISLIIIYVLHIINFNIIPHEANFQPDAAPRVADNNRSTENWWFTWSNLRRRSSDPNSSSEGNRTLLATSNSESITSLLVVCR